MASAKRGFTLVVMGFFVALVLIGSQDAWADAEVAMGAAQPMVFFDLGGVLIDTSDFENTKYMPGAEAYINDLIARGYRLGLITNVPEDWGADRPERVRALKEFVAESWREARPFPWHLFSVVIVPEADRLRKPHPAMFVEAFATVSGCRPVFQGDTAEEVRTATEVGYTAYLIGQPGKPACLPPEGVSCEPLPRASDR